MQTRHEVTREIFDRLQSCGGLQVRTAPSAALVKGYVSGWALWAQPNKAATAQDKDTTSGKMKRTGCDLSWGHYVRTELGDASYGMDGNFCITNTAFAALQPQLLSNLVFVTRNASAPASKGGFEPYEFFHSQRESLFRSYVYDERFQGTLLRSAYITDIFKMSDASSNQMPIESNATFVGKAVETGSINEADNYDILYQELRLLSGDQEVFLVPMMPLAHTYCEKFVAYIASKQASSKGQFRVASEPVYHYARQGKHRNNVAEMSRRLQQAADEFSAWDSN